jgi:hypothetical protein
MPDTCQTRRWRAGVRSCFLHAAAPADADGRRVANWRRRSTLCGAGTRCSRPTPCVMRRNGCAVHPLRAADACSSRPRAAGMATRRATAGSSGPTTHSRTPGDRGLHSRPPVIKRHRQSPVDSCSSPPPGASASEGVGPTAPEPRARRGRLSQHVPAASPRHGISAQPPRWTDSQPSDAVTAARRQHRIVRRDATVR